MHSTNGTLHCLHKKVPEDLRLLGAIAMKDIQITATISYHKISQAYRGHMALCLTVP